jgi:translation initiation factor 1A
MYSLFIRLPANRTITIDSTDCHTIYDIRTRICEREGYPSQSPLTLLYKNRILKNDEPIPSEPDATIYATFPILGGGKHGNNHRNRQNTQIAKRELVIAVPDESDYGQVLKLLGDKRAEVICLSSGKLLMCRIAGRIHQWIQREDIVLVGLRNFEPGKGDIIMRYTPSEARKLIKSGYIPTSIKINSNENIFDANSAGVEFVDDTGGVENDDGLIQNRTYELPSSDSEEEDENADVNIDNI